MSIVLELPNVLDVIRRHLNALEMLEMKIVTVANASNVRKPQIYHGNELKGKCLCVE